MATPTLTMSTMIRNQMILTGQGLGRPELLSLALLKGLEESQPLLQLLPALPGFAKEVEYGVIGNDIPGQTRGYNQESTPNAGEVQIAMEQESVRVYETWEEIDYLNDQRTEYNAARELERQARITGLANTISEDLFVNINTANPFKLRGLKQRITPGNLLPATEGSTISTPLSMKQAKRAIDFTPGGSENKFIAVDYDLMILFENAAKSGRDGEIRFIDTDFGKQIVHFRGIPMIALGVNSNNGRKWLDFNEPGVDGAGETTSMYVISTAPGGAALFFRSMPKWHDRPGSNSMNRKVYPMEIGFVVTNPNSIKRVHSIQKADFVD